MKKILIALAVVVLALALVACGGEANVTEDTTPVTEAPAEHVHAYSEEIVAPTCAAQGTRKMVCECGDVQSEETLGFADHTPSVADCEKDTVCTVCNEVLSAATGHIISAVETVTEATCSTPGKEKGSCVSCGKVIETEIPASGHVSSGAPKAVDGGFAVTCSICNQAVTLKAQTPVFLLDFEEDIATQAAKYDIGLSVYKPESWKIAEVNGSKAFTADDGKPFYINIVDPTKLASLGSFVISFDYTSTKEAKEDQAGSVFSILGNHQNSVQTSAGAVQWGWMLKLVEAKKVLATTNAADKVTSENSVAVERNVKYNVQIVISAADKATHTFINGKYIGSSNQVYTTFTKFAPANTAIRFGDGPVCGHIFDNFTISPLK